MADDLLHLPAIAKKLQGRVAVITGGASGIGEATVRLFIRHGAKVVIADVQDELGESLVRSLLLTISNEENAIVFFHCDVTVEEDVAAVVDFAVDKFGKLDVMFNNAGIGHSPTASLLDLEKTTFEHVLAVNLIGPFLGTKHASRVMIAGGGGGAIINTSSIAGTVTATPTMLAYGCSKSAVVSLTTSTAVELGRHGIRVNCVSPGGVPTPFISKYMFGMSPEKMKEIQNTLSCLKGVEALKAEDIAATVLYLAGDESRCVTGMNVVVDLGVSIGYVDVEAALKARK